MSEETNNTPPATLAPGFKAGFVGMAGTPNVGKSTLVNRLVGQKISIVSKRPQTTRERVAGILTDEKMQAVLLDLPGIIEPRDAFNEAIVNNAAQGLTDCDLILHICDARRGYQEEVAPVEALLRHSKAPVWLIWNKLDRLPSRELSRRHDPPVGAPVYGKTFAISAKTGRGVDKLAEAMRDALPEGVPFYDPEQVCDRNLRFMAAELVREKLFRFLGEELPYATATWTEEFDENRGPKVYINVVIQVERPTQKPMVIGHEGQLIKRIGESARREIEGLMDRPVYLDLWVKVRPKWRKNEHELIRLGYKDGVSG